MDERFAARDRNHRGAALVGGVPALLGGEAFIENMIGVLNFATTRARKIAAEEGLEHKDERIPFDPAQFLPENIGGDGPSLANRNWHRRSEEATNLQAIVNGSRKQMKNHKALQKNDI